MAEFKLMTRKEYFNFVNTSTLIGNLNTGQGSVPELYNLQQPVEPVANSKKIVYNNSNFIADNTKIQSNYMNPRGIK
tara:strand:+ start:370 stop:600 length:231 start_codon:yes stop_codon:yes gene_type:complete